MWTTDGVRQVREDMPIEFLMATPATFRFACGNWAGYLCSRGRRGFGAQRVRSTVGLCPLGKQLVWQDAFWCRDHSAANVYRRYLLHIGV